MGWVKGGLDFLFGRLMKRVDRYIFICEIYFTKFFLYPVSAIVKMHKPNFFKNFHLYIF